MSISYPVRYEDEFGVETTSVTNEDGLLTMSLRGIDFIAVSFFSFSALPAKAKSAQDLFNFLEGNLCSYSIDCQIPVLLSVSGNVSQTLLHAHIECGNPVDAPPNWRRVGGDGSEKLRTIDRHELRLACSLKENTYKSGGKSNDFETELLELFEGFPPGTFFEICMNCGLSSYPPSIVSGLRCFRNARSELRQVEGMWEMLKLWDEKGIDVQETYHCMEFEKKETSG